jgi:nucleotide-binding universal stress UspA family protein
MLDAKTTTRERGRTDTLAFRSSIHRVLCPTDLSPGGDAAIAHARLIAERFGAHLTLYHSIDLRHVLRTSGSIPLADGIRRAELAAIRHLETRVAGTSTTKQVLVDYGMSPHDAVSAAIAARCPDLTVMWTHGRRGIAHLLKGSVAETAIEETARPTLCVRGGHEAAPRGYRRILVPTDLHARGAFALAAAIARAFEAEVVALHLVPLSRVSLSGLPEALDAHVPDAADVARFLLPEFDDLPVRARVELGPGWEAIPAVAGEERCDLVVLTTHRHDSLADGMLGSHAERIAAIAPCPVLVV